MSSDEISIESIDGIVDIPNVGLYAKCPEALKRLFEALRAKGYEINDSSISKTSQEVSAISLLVKRWRKMAGRYGMQG